MELAGGGSETLQSARLPLLLAIFVANGVLLSLELLGDLTILLCVVLSSVSILDYFAPYLSAVYYT